MSIQSTAGCQQDSRNCMHSLDNSFSSMYQPQMQDTSNAHNASFFEPPYVKYQMSSGQTNESDFNDVIDREDWIDQSMAILQASNQLYNGLSDVEVPSIRPRTTQCDPWCSAAMHRQVQSSDMLSWDHALAKCGAKILRDLESTPDSGPSRSLPISHLACTAADELEYTPFLFPTTALATGDLAGSTRPNDGSLMAMPETPGKDAGLVPDGDGEQDYTLRNHPKVERWPNGYLLPFSEYPTKDDHLQGIRLGVASPNCLDGLAHTPWNGNTMDLNSFLPLPKDDGTFLGLEVSGFAPHGDGEQSHTLRGELKAERWPHGYHVPVGYLPACKSNLRRKRRRFTNGEKMIISYKRKVGVCRDCRHAKRKCTHVQLDMGNEATKSGSGFISTRLQGSSVFDDSATI